MLSDADIIFINTCRGHGTYSVDGQLIASVAGVVERVNKLIYVKPLKSRYHNYERKICIRTLIIVHSALIRYNGEVGDVVVGRILEVPQNFHSPFSINPLIPIPIPL